MLTSKTFAKQCILSLLLMHKWNENETMPCGIINQDLEGCGAEFLTL